MDKKLGRFDIQLFGDVIPDVAASPAALPAGAAGGSMAVFNARQVVG
jgi:hypothetical protein